MKMKCLSVFTALLILVTSCTSNNEIGSDFQQKTQAYNSNFQFQNRSNHSAKINKQKALMLALVDAGAGYSVAGIWAVPYVGVFAGLWISFAASWAASGANAQRTTPVIPLRVDTSSIESLIRSNSTVQNPYEELGQKHNIALNDLGTSQISMLDSQGNLDAVTENYMNSHSFMTTTANDRATYITNATNRTNVENTFKAYGTVVTINDLNYQLSQNAHSTSTEKDFVYSINSYLESNQSSLDGASITRYIDGLESIVLNDGSLTSTERQELLQYLSVLNYSYCFWEKQL